MAKLNLMAHTMQEPGQATATFSFQLQEDL